MRRITVGLFCAALVMAAVWALLPMSSRTKRVPVTLTVAGITNDSAGVRYATFRLLNHGAHKVSVVPSFVIENTSGLWRTNLVPPRAKILRTNLMGSFSLPARYSGPALLAPGECVNVTLCLPFDEDTWRASFWYLEVRLPLEGLFEGLSRSLTGKPGLDGLQRVSTGWQN